MTEQLVRDTLVIALEDRARSGHPVPDELIHHSDHSSVYTAIRYGGQLRLAGMLPSFGTVGDSYDNALAETVNGLYKAECVAQDGPFATLADVLAATLDWVRWYNTSRLHEHLGYHPGRSRNRVLFTHGAAGNPVGHTMNQRHQSLAGPERWFKVLVVTALREARS